jgi:hypothetical protein
MILSLEDPRNAQNLSQTSPNIVDWLHLWFENKTKIRRNSVILLGNMEPARGLEPRTC